MKSKLRDIFGCLVVLPLLGLVALTTPIWLPILMLQQAWTERCHRSHMKGLGRFAAWTDLLGISDSGRRGTLIFEQAQKTPLRVWWTPDEDVTSHCPEQPPIEDEIDYFRFDEVSPFMRWIHERYTGDLGRGILTDYRPPGIRGFARIADFEATGFVRIIPSVRLS